MKPLLLAAAIAVLVSGCAGPNNDPDCEPDGCGEPLDLGIEDAQSNGSDDAGAVDDAGAPDAAASDAGTADLGHADAGPADGGVADSGAADGGADAGMSRHRGVCMTDADCGNPDFRCVTIPENDPGGFHVCQAAEAAEPGCADIEFPDECCLHSDCTDAPGGTCVPGPIFYCGGAAPTPANVCLYDECASDADCGGGPGSCLPALVFGEPVSRCISSECGNDADCDAGTDGECRPMFSPCNGRLSGFYCTYEDSECRTDADCDPDPNQPGTPYCSPGQEQGDTECMNFLPLP